MIGKLLALAAAIVLAVVFAAAAQTPSAMPKLSDNTVACGDFQKNPDGTWSALRDTSFTLAGLPMTVKAGARIDATSYFAQNNRLIDTLNGKCKPT